MVKRLEKNSRFAARRGSVVLLIMDGIGLSDSPHGNAVAAALTTSLDRMFAEAPWVTLKAHGTAVGLPSDEDMGNSEVGHNAIGCGRVFSQGAKLVSESINTGRIFEGAVWKRLVSRAGTSGTLHFIGLFSDGNVHSHLDHLKAMIKRAKADGVRRVRIHALLDGRDVGETSALEYVIPFEAFLASLNGPSFDARIASGGGRMAITMDRYGANWDMVRKGWETHVLGEGKGIPQPLEKAVETLRAETNAIDQDLPPFVIHENGKPVGTVEDGDAVVFFNFRGDRALEITAAFEDPAFTRFDRKRIPKVEYAGMMQYDGDLKVPKQYLVEPPSIDRTLGEYLAETGVRQLAVSETQKFGHVTYFFNGNRTGKFSEELEEYVEIPSDIVPFEQRPWMKSAEITDTVISAIESGKFPFIRLNFPNGDMVGHTGVYQAAVCAVESVDICLGRIRKAVEKAGGVLIVTADHGNSEEMYELDKKTGAPLLKANGEPKAKTSHTLNPVPCIIYDPEGRGEYGKELRKGKGISSLAATVIHLLGYLPPDDYDESLLVMG